MGPNSTLDLTLLNFINSQLGTKENPIPELVVHKGNTLGWPEGVFVTDLQFNKQSLRRIYEQHRYFCSKKLKGCFALHNKEPTHTHSHLFKVWSIKFLETETHSPIKPDSERIEKTVTFAEKLKSEKHAQESSKQREMVLLPALLLVGFDENSMSLVVKSVHSVCTAMQEHKAQFEQLVGCLIHCSLQSHLVVCSSDPYLSTLNDVNFEILIPDKVLAMILSVLSTSDLLNTIV